MTASRLDWPTRVLLATAEAADATLPRGHRAEIACVVADKCSDALANLSTVRSLQMSVFDAIDSVGLGESLNPGAVYRFVWRIVFDLWGGPVR